jgi:hypothetical protein
MRDNKLLSYRRPRPWWLLAGSIMTCMLVCGCAGTGDAGGAIPSASDGAMSSSTPKAIQAAISACYNRPEASGDIYVRMTDPGLQPQAQELGGEWTWDYAINKCLTTVQSNISTGPQNAGFCAQVGYVADNPGYNVDDTPAPPLQNVVAQTRPAC